MPTPPVSLQSVLGAQTFIKADNCQNSVSERTGLVVRASDSGSGDPGSILGRVGVLFP